MRKFPDPRQAYESGMSLVEVMVSIALAAILAFGVSTFMAKYAESTLQQKLVQTRDALAAKVRNTASSPAALAFSAKMLPLNAQLQQCVDTVPGGGACAANTAYDFTLFEAIRNSVPLGGPPGGTVKYKTDGTPCTNPAAVDCVFEVEVTFRYMTETPVGVPPSCI